jgi:hypothetical protein
MTMNKFNSIDELRSVKRRLYFKKEELEIEIKNNFSDLKKSYSPSGIFHRITDSFSSGNGHDSSHNGVASAAPAAGTGVVNNAAATMLDLVVNDIFLRRSNIFKRLITSYIIRLFGPAVISNAGPALKNLIMKSGLFSKTKTKEATDY